MVVNTRVRAISLKIDQDEWLRKQRQEFNFSKYCQEKLDDYMKMIDGVKIEVTG